jgi:RNA polymerase sigma-70 factor (ECF subfamily)
MALDAIEFRKALETHQRMVFSIALRITGVYETAEEVAQDVFLELYRGAPQLAGEDHLRFWLRRVSVHRSTDALRKRQRQPEQAAEEWIEEQHSDAEPLADARQLSLEARLDELLRALPETQRVVVVLRFTEGLWPEEIAKLLGQPLATVKSNLQRGLALMRRKAGVTMKEYVRETN